MPVDLSVVPTPHNSDTQFSTHIYTIKGDSGVAAWLISLT